MTPMTAPETTRKPRRPLRERFDVKWIPVPESGCWLWLSHTNPSGYGEIFLNGKLKRAHRISWELHRGEILDGLWVLHKCDVRCCVNPEHLFLGTRKDNMDDMATKGRRADGVRHYLARLGTDEVRAIRSATGTHGHIASRFGVHRVTVGQIKRGERYASVP